MVTGDWRMVLLGSLRCVADVGAAEEEESATPVGMKGRVCSNAKGQVSHLRRCWIGNPYRDSDGVGALYR